jgi:hypothetical protein
MPIQDAAEWNTTLVRTWLESRVIAARAEQGVAERGGRGRQDDCDQATAEEMVCSISLGARSTATQGSFLTALQALLDREEYTWRGVYDDRRFDRHVRSFIKKLMRMTKTNDGFQNVGRYQ